MGERDGEAVAWRVELESGRVGYRFAPELIDAGVSLGASPQPLTAAEVTEPGWYWYGEDGEWEVLEVWRETGRDRYIWRAGDSSPLDGARLPGTFIGPLRAPTAD